MMILKITRDKSLKELPRLWADSKIFEFPTIFLRYACPWKSAGNSKILESAHNRSHSFEELSLNWNIFVPKSGSNMYMILLLQT